MIFEYFHQLIDLHGVTWMVGQAFGIVAILLGFLNYQMRTQRMILLVQTITSMVFCVHYFLIGAYAGTALNAINIFRNVTYNYRLNKGLNDKLIPLSFVTLQSVACIVTSEAWYAVFALAGIGLSSYCMSFSDSQRVRKSILITSPLVLIYNALSGSVGGCIYETVAIISAVIGILQNRKKSIMK